MRRIGTSSWGAGVLTALVVLSACTFVAEPSSDEAAVYGAVARTVTELDVIADPAFGQRIVFVLDRPVSGTGDVPVEGSEPGPRASPFGADVREAIVSAIEPALPVEFVSDRDAVVVGAPCAEVVRNGVLLILGPLNRRGSAVTLGVETIINCVGGQGMAFTVQESRGTWLVTDIRVTWVS
jgi:hypothetical protein